MIGKRFSWYYQYKIYYDFWLFEKAKYDPDSGANLTNGTWEYHLPTTKDVPADFRVSAE